METAASSQDDSTAAETVAASQVAQPKSVQKELHRNAVGERDPEMILLSRYSKRARNPPDRLNL